MGAMQRAKTAASCLANATRVEGKKITGNRLGKQVTGGTDASCCALCVANSNCSLYSYTNAKGVKPSKCWLHDGDSSGYKSTSKVTTTRVRGGSGPPPPPPPPSPPAPRPRNWKPYDLSLGSKPHTTPQPAGAAGFDGTYSASLYGPRAVDMIEKHDWGAGGAPMYMYLAMQNVHTPMECPPSVHGGDCSHACKIRQSNATRSILCGMITALDNAIGTIVDALKVAKVYNESVFVIHADNGGSVAYSSSNYPKRGGKFTMWQGGVNVNALISSPLLPAARRNTSWHGLAHSSDWLPTVAAIAGLKFPLPEDAAGGMRPRDGMNLWPALVAGGASPRTEVMMQIFMDPKKAREGAIAQTSQDGTKLWKLIATPVGKWNDWCEYLLLSPRLALQFGTSSHPGRAL